MFHDNAVYTKIFHINNLKCFKYKKRYKYYGISCCFVGCCMPF